MRITSVMATTLVSCATLLASPDISAAATREHRPANGCSSDVAAAFTWWVGKWNYSVPKFDPGTSTVAAADGGCALTEAFVDRTGQQQHTTIRYDSTAHTWKRHVVDPFRTYDSAGSFASDGSISFYETPSQRESYRPADRDHVHFVGESSGDGGKTWKVDFDATYTRQP
jgi:hypothetical protein